jgi:cell division protein ZapA
VSRSVKVEIAGQKFAVRTDAKPKYVRDLAEFVTRKIEEARSTGKIVTTQSLALLAAMSIADELYQLRERQETLQREVRRRSETILRFLDKEANP